MTTYGNVFGPAMEITDPVKAESFLRERIRERMAAGESFEDAVERVKSNIGYMTGYGDLDVRRRVQKLFRCVHPIFGISEPTPEEAFEMGQQWAEGKLKFIPQPPENPSILQQIDIDSYMRTQTDHVPKIKG